MKTYRFVRVLFLMICCLGALACAHSDAFQTKLRAMPDTDLVNYYHGINERIKDIENNASLSQRSDFTRHDQEMSQSSFFLGGEGQELLSKQRLIRKEMNRRHLTNED